MITSVRHDPDFMSYSVLPVDDDSSVFYRHRWCCMVSCVTNFMLIILSTLSTFDMVGLRKWAGFESRLSPTPEIPVQCHISDAHNNIHVIFLSKNMYVSLWQYVIVYYFIKRKISKT
jgi:hypothetical protein